MRVLVSSVGTRGDVQPAIALALELRALGHALHLCVPPNFTAWAAELGLEASPIGVEMRAPAPGAAPVKIPDLITDQFDAVGAAAEGCDLIVGAGAHQYAARSIAELRGVPFVVAVYAPVSLPCADLAPPGHPAVRFEAPENRRQWEIYKQGWNDRSLERVNTNRARLGLPPVADVITHILGERPWLAADPTLGPAPDAPDQPVLQTGAWLLPDARPLDPALDAFLNAGEAPIYMGFGSMPTREGTSRTLVEAARAVGRRVILSQGWGGLGPIDDGPDCLSIGEVNQAALFPRVAAVVHHGGAGTLTAAAQAGAPQVAVPMFSDQHYWGQRLRDLGIGAATPSATLSVDALAAALREALQPEVVAQARQVAPQVRVDGAAVAARRLTEILG